MDLLSAMWYSYRLRRLCLGNPLEVAAALRRRFQSRAPEARHGRPDTYPLSAAQAFAIFFLRRAVLTTMEAYNHRRCRC